MQARQSTQLDRDFVSLSPNDISGFLYGIGIVNTMAAAPCRKAMGHGARLVPLWGAVIEVTAVPWGLWPSPTTAQPLWHS